MNKKNNVVSDEQLNKYFNITGEALEAVKKAEMDKERLNNAKDFLDMATRYYSDAKHFKKQGDFVLAFAALNYAHGWLDAGARIGLFKVKDSRLFTVDEE
ncbi:MAG: DUF357 domain-containing protein [Nanoarchaeota archaeon]|nr:DUF357 domain-containing protein [Nanoarchaeota archaeon]MBU1030147.1 DUF357 domain-containing protein [Nanoarchaeota archaeon]MBU1850423.1 DUF357 domain-containing protein [Nanoarchaeota archaeon]